MREQEILELLEKSDVILRGHFLLSSGLHSDTYVQCAKIFEHPLLSMKIIEALVEKVEKMFKRDEIDLVLSPAMGGVICGYELARQLLKRNIFVERVENVFQLRRNFQIKNGERILLVEDVVTTGKSSAEAARVAQSFGGKIVGVACVIDRRGEQTDPSFNYEVASVLKLDIKAWPAEALPPHLAGSVAVKPGSRKQ